MNSLPKTMTAGKDDMGTDVGFSVPFTTVFSAKKLVSFSRAMAVMVKAQLSLVRAFDTLMDQMDGEEQKILTDIKRSVEKGKGLAESLEQYPDIFSSSYIYLVKVGEETGRLPEMLERIADSLEKKQQLRQKVQSAMMYPGLVFTVSVGAFLFLLTVVVPSFSQLYADFEADMPYMTSLVLDISRFFTEYIWYLLIGSGVLVLGSWSVLNTSTGKYYGDRLLLKIPLLGSLLLKNITADYSQTLGTLLKNGVPLTESLSLVEKTQSNSVFVQATQKFKKAVRRGESLASAVKSCGVFPKMAEEMIAVGEETAELDDLLLYVADNYTREVDIKVESLTSILEPLLIVFLGILVGSIIISLYLPIFDLMNVVQ